MKRIAEQFILRLRGLPRVHTAILRLAKLISPPYFSEANAEIRHFHWEITSAARCKDNRPLGEANTVPKYLVPNFELVDRVGKLPGSRKGLPVNQTALQVVMRNWNPAIQIIAEMRDAYVRCRGISAGALNYADILALAKTCSALPPYLMRRSTLRLSDGDLPSPVATIFKLVLGVHATIESMINSGEPSFDPFATPTAEKIYEYAEENGLFVSGRNAACGGPPGKILQLLEIIIDGAGQQNSHDENAEHVIELIGDLELAVKYGIHVTRLEAAIRMFQSEAAATFVNKKLRESARSAEEIRSYSHLRKMAIDDLSRIKFPDNYWPEKAIILEKVLNELCLESATDADNFTEMVPSRDWGCSELKSQACSFDSLLKLAIQRYEEIIQRGCDFCNNEQMQINRCLGIAGEIQFSRENFARRLNNNLAEAVDLMKSRSSVHLAPEIHKS